MNRSATRYATRICVQPGFDNVELIADMKDAVKGLLLEFYQQNRGQKPERLVLYRDGVAEGQFPQVRPPRPRSQLHSHSPGHRRST
eukprot:3247493-Pyramimonas_sp.AAC.1